MDWPSVTDYYVVLVWGVMKTFIFKLLSVFILVVIMGWGEVIDLYSTSCGSQRCKWRVWNAAAVCVWPLHPLQLTLTSKPLHWTGDFFVAERCTHAHPPKMVWVLDVIYIYMYMYICQIYFHCFSAVHFGVALFACWWEKKKLTDFNFLNIFY